MACERELMPASAEGEKEALSRAKLEHTYLYRVQSLFIFSSVQSYSYEQVSLNISSYINFLLAW